MKDNYFKKEDYLNFLKKNYEKPQEKKNYFKKAIAYSGVVFGSVGLLIALSPIKWVLIGGIGAIFFPGVCNKSKANEKNIEQKVMQEQTYQSNSNTHAYNLAYSFMHADPI